MTYTGDVSVGGPSDVRMLPAARITKVATPPFENNCYLVRCRATGDTLLVDAAGDPERLLAEVGDGRLVAVLETHGHWDHQQALAEVVDATGADVLAHPDDAGDLPVPVTRLLRDGDQVEVGRLTMTVRHLVGHTPGSLALVLDAGDDGVHVFSGDSLFPGGPGNTDKDPARFASLMDDLEGKLFSLPDGTWVYPGHGRDTTIGAERPSVPQWRERGW